MDAGRKKEKIKIEKMKYLLLVFLGFLLFGAKCNYAIKANFLDYAFLGMICFAISVVFALVYEYQKEKQNEN
jgi:hypothetical protein